MNDNGSFPPDEHEWSWLKYPPRIFGVHGFTFGLFILTPFVLSFWFLVFTIVVFLVDRYLFAKKLSFVGIVGRLAYRVMLKINPRRRHREKLKLFRINRGI